MNAATILLIIMWAFAAVFLVILVKDIQEHKNELDKSKLGFNSIVSMVTNFFDTRRSEAMPSQQQHGSLIKRCRTI